MAHPASPLHNQLADAGAHWHDLPADCPFPMPAHFGDPQAELEAGRGGPALADLSARITLRLSGDDVAAWLTGMVSNAVKTLEPGQSRYGFTLTRQGRIVSDLSWVRVGEAEFLADLPPARAAAVREHFEKYIIMEKVTVEDASGEFAQLLGIGDVKLPGLAIAPSALAGEGVAQSLIPADRVGDVWAALLDAGARPIGLEALNALRVQAGVPWCGVDFGESNLPAETGQLGRAVSFTKGCYIGQEVVARMQSLGAPSKVLTAVHLSGDIPPRTAPAAQSPPPDILVDGAPVGRLTSVARIDGQTLGLAIIARKHAAPGTAVEVDAGDGVRVAGELRPAGE